MKPHNTAPQASHPGPLVGIMGGGQLGRMLAMAAAQLGVRVRVLDPSPDCCAAQVAEAVRGRFENTSDLELFAADVDLFTYEWENVPARAAQWLEARAPVFPPPALLEIAQDRFHQKSLFDSLDVPVPVFAAIDSRAALDRAVEHIGFPAVLKTRRDGYDGKGQGVLESADQLDAAWERLGNVCGGAQPGLILEAFVPFDREVSLIAVRSRTGDSAFYPLGENRHVRGILHTTHAPADPGSHPLQRDAEGIARRIMEHFDYVGVLAIEFFELNGELLVNEMATRVHNSGHWTLDGAETSQFENHIRAVLGLPLGSTRPFGKTVMLNLVGRTPEPARVLAIPGAHLHLYGKAPVPGRKLGHVNFRRDGAFIAEEEYRELLN